jgi:hypothetical protein
MSNQSEIDRALEIVIRVLKLCPKWKPGEQNGKKRTTLYCTYFFDLNKIIYIRTYLYN